MIENENKNLKISYHIADTMGDRRPVRSSDAYGNYKSFEEAQRDYKYDQDGDNAILANINGDWYRTAKFTDGVVRYRSLDRLVTDWHTLDETIRGVNIENIDFERLLAIAATIAYCDGSLAKELGISQVSLREYDFHEKFSQYFGYPMYEAAI